MDAVKITTQLQELAEDRSVKNNLSFNSAFILAPADRFFFDRTEDNFYDPAFRFITQNPEWAVALEKPHPEYSMYNEVQSASSTMALLMNVFCNPEDEHKKALAAMFRQDKIRQNEIVFGHRVELASKKQEGEIAEIDLFLNESSYSQAFLGETDMGNEPKSDLMELRDFTRVFAIGYLPQNNKSYLYSKLIRGMLAAYQDGYDFRIITDSRRTDLIKGFYNLASSIIDVSFRTKCKPLFWQEMAGVSGVGLQEYLKEKYEIRV
jgi:hypothetical protein